jgi:hypothetical protein
LQCHRNQLLPLLPVGAAILFQERCGRKKAEAFLGVRAFKLLFREFRQAAYCGAILETLLSLEEQDAPQDVLRILFRHDVAQAIAGIAAGRTLEAASMA